MKKCIFTLLLLIFLLTGCSLKTGEFKNIPQLSSKTSKEENKTNHDKKKKASEQTDFEKQLNKMLQEIDNLEFDKEDDGYPKDLK